jgi:hypothetical protein
MGIVVQHDVTPCEHGRTFFLDGSMKDSQGSAVVLCVGGEVRVLEC